MGEENLVKLAVYKIKAMFYFVNYYQFSLDLIVYDLGNDQLCDLQPYTSSRCGKETGERGKTLARSIMIIITASSYDVTFFSLF